MSNQLSGVATTGTVTFTVRSVPISDSVGHTYVVGTDAPTGNVRRYGCFGRYGQPTTAGGVWDAGSTLLATMNNGDFRYAATLVCGDPTEGATILARHNHTNINDFHCGDNCDLVYGFEGVCHNMANRIIRAQGPFPIHPVVGNRISYRFFGTMGHGYYPGYANKVSGIVALGSTPAPVPERNQASSLTDRLFEIDLRDVSEEEKAAARLREYLSDAFGDTPDAQKQTDMQEADLALWSTWDELKKKWIGKWDAQKTRPQIVLEPSQLAQLNAVIGKHLEKEQAILGKDGFVTLYGVSYSDRIKLFMEDSQDE